MVRKVPQYLLVLILADIAAAFVFNNTLDEDDDLIVFNNRRQAGRDLMDIPKKGGDESTSSEGKRRESGGSSGGGSSESLQQSFSGSATSTDTDEKGRPKKDRIPKSSLERKGWRKWHRKCTQCPDEMNMKWRDPRIKWICGAYQRARRSFKSLCMMHLRNCQDGTMFTKIADHRCQNESSIRPFGDHFFYDYSVALTDDDTKTDDAEVTSVEESESSSWDSSRIRKLPPLDPGQ